MDINEKIRKAEAGSCVNQTILGCLYLYGLEGVEVDYQEAFRWLLAASNAGGSRAVGNLGHMYAEGLGIPKNIPEAIRHFNSVSSSEYVAQIGLARIYARGVGVAVDHKAAVKWYKASIAPIPTDAPIDEDIQEAIDYIAKYDDMESEPQE